MLQRYPKKDTKQERIRREDGHIYRLFFAEWTRGVQLGTDREIPPAITLRTRSPREDPPALRATKDIRIGTADVALTFSIWNNTLTMKRAFLDITMHSISRRREEAIHCGRHLPPPLTKRNTPRPWERFTFSVSTMLQKGLYFLTCSPSLYLVVEHRVSRTSSRPFERAF